MESTPKKTPELTVENYSKGFLVDEDLMAGVGRTDTGYMAYVICHTNAQHLGTRDFLTLEEAIHSLNEIDRDWKFEFSSECGGGACQEGNCGTGSCKKVVAGLNCS